MRKCPQPGILICRQQFFRKDVNTKVGWILDVKVSVHELNKLPFILTDENSDWIAPIGSEEIALQDIHKVVCQSGGLRILWGITLQVKVKVRCLPMNWKLSLEVF